MLRGRKRLSLGEIQALNVILEIGGKFGKAHTVVVHKQVREPRMFDLHRRLLDAHAIDPRIGLAESNRELILLERDRNFKVGLWDSHALAERGVIAELLRAEISH
jgi:hypothetical protein